MLREQLVAEAYAAGKAAEHNLRFIRSNPDKVDMSKLPDMESYLQLLIDMEKREQGNERRKQHLSLRTRLKNLVRAVVWDASHLANK